MRLGEYATFPSEARMNVTTFLKVAPPSNWEGSDFFVFWNIANSQRREQTLRLQPLKV